MYGLGDVGGDCGGGWLQLVRLLGVAVDDDSAELGAAVECGVGAGVRKGRRGGAVEGGRLLRSGHPTELHSVEVRGQLLVGPWRMEGNGHTGTGGEGEQRRCQRRVEMRRRLRGMMGSLRAERMIASAGGWSTDGRCVVGGVEGLERCVGWLPDICGWVDGRCAAAREGGGSAAAAGARGWGMLSSDSLQGWASSI